MTKNEFFYSGNFNFLNNIFLVGTSTKFDVVGFWFNYLLTQKKIEK